MFPVAHFDAGTTHATADQVQTIAAGAWSTGVTTYDTYYLLSNSPTNPSIVKWVKVGDVSLSSYDAVSLLPGDRSAFIRVNAALPAYVTPSPWSP